jgi:transmembrane protein EpsG
MGLSYFQTNLKGITNYINSYKIISLVPIILISSLRSNSVGTDTENYNIIFTEIVDLWSSFDNFYLLIFLFEPLYYSLQLLVKYFNFDFTVLLFSVSIIIWFVIYFSSKNRIKYFYHVIFFSITGGFLFFTFNGVRQAIAMAFVFLSVNYFIDSKKKKFFLTIFVASLFHYSAILLIPIIWFISKINFQKVHWIIIFFVALMIPESVFYSSISYIFSYFPFYSNYIKDIIQDGYGLSTITFGVFLNYIILLLPLLYFKVSKINSYNKLIFNISFFGAFLYIIFSGNMIFQRFIVYFTFFQIFQYSLIFDYLKKINKKYDKMILTLFFFIVFLIKIFVNDSGISPYIFN